MSAYDIPEIVRVLNLEALPTPLSGVPSSLTETYGVFIKDTNAEKNLILVHYHDSVEMGKVPATHGVRTVRGVILDVSAIPYKVACPSLAYVPTIVMHDTFYDAIEHGVSDGYGMDADGVPQHICMEDGSIADAYEGVMLRIWEHTGPNGSAEIMVSSYKKINCLDSHWGTGENFGEQLAKFVDLDKVTFGADKAPHFVLLSTPAVMTVSDEVSAVRYISGPGADMVPGSQPETYHRSLNRIKIQELGAVIVFTEGPNGTFLRARLVTPTMAWRLMMVGNDPNVLHRSYMLLDEVTSCGAPGSTSDTYLSKFPPVPVVTDDMEVLTRADIYTHGKLFTPEQLTNKKDPEVFERRIRNALTHYALAISSHYTAQAAVCIGKVIDERKQLVKVLQKNFKRFKEGDFKDFGNYKLGYANTVAKFYTVRLKNAASYAASSKVPINKVIETSVMRDKGQNVYRMVEFLGLRKKESVAVKVPAEKSKLQFIDIDHVKDYAETFGTTFEDACRICLNEATFAELQKRVDGLGGSFLLNCEDLNYEIVLG